MKSPSINEFGWICPECSNSNDDSMLRCPCGYETTNDKIIYQDVNCSPCDLSTISESSASSSDVDEILKLVAGAENQNTWVKNIIVLLASLSLLIFVGIIKWDANNLAAIVVAIFIHELGHLLAMKLTGRQNLQILFIPLIGGMAFGEPQEEDAADNTVVALFGPLVGLLSAVASAFLFSLTGMALFRTYAEMAVILNVLNLLPIYPLDGGRFFNDLLFYKYFKLETTFRVSAALLLFIIALKLFDWILFFIGLIVIMPLKINFAIAQLTKEYMQKYGAERVVNRRIIEYLRNELIHRIPALRRSRKSQGIIAKYIKIILKKANTRHATPKQIFILVFLYGIALVILPFFVMSFVA